MTGDGRNSTTLSAEPDQNHASLIERVDRRFSRSIKFADTFPCSLVRIFDGIKNISHLFIKALVTYRLASGRYACGLAAWTGNAAATLGFVQSINGTHRTYLVGELVKRQVAC